MQIEGREAETGAGHDWRRSAFLHAPTAILVTDESGRYVDANQAACELTGYTRNELLELTVADLASSEYRPLFVAQWGEFTGQGRMAGTYALRRKDGSAVEVSYWAVTDVAPGFHMSFLSERRLQSAEASTDNERVFRELAHFIPNIVWISDAQGRSSFVNERYYEYTDLPYREDTSGDFDPVVHPEDREGAFSAWEKAVSTGTPWIQELRLLRHDGEWRWHLSRQIPVRDDSGHIVRWFGTSTDIHEQKMAAMGLAESEQRFRLMVEQSPMSVQIVSPEGRILQANRAWESLWGVTLEDLADFNLWEDTQLEERGILGYLRRALEGESCFVPPVGFVPDRGRYAGQEVWVRAVVYPVKQDGAVKEIVILQEDITEQRRVQVALEEREHQLRELNRELEQRVKERTAELQDAVKELEGFTYSVSHDLRTPLRSISATSHILVTEWGAELGSEAKDLLYRQASSANRLAKLIDDLLKLSRLGRAEITRNDIDFSALCSEVVSEIQARSTYFTGDFEIQSGMQVRADRQQLRFVMLNLLENAAKFSPESGTIHVGQQDEGTVFVRDQGIGFDMSYSDKLFRPFERLVRDEEFEGTGIGLANVKRIIERHGGRVWAESEPNRGATFYFNLPD